MLDKDRNTAEAQGKVEAFPVLAAVTIFAGSLVVIDSNGWAKPGLAATGLRAVGRAEEHVDNSTGANGAETVRVKRGVFRYGNSAAGDAITKADIGNNCYIVDDEVVAKTSGDSTRSIAGRIMGVDAQGVWVALGGGILNAPGAALLAANNLDDVGSAATARANLNVSAGLGTPAFTIGAEAANAINVAVQLKDAAGVNLAVRGSVTAYLSDSATGADIAATAPDGGVAVGTEGLAIPLVADKAFQLVSNAAGVVDLDIGESGADTFYLVIVGENGGLTVSDAITFA
jgi:hypothetical protein